MIQQILSQKGKQKLKKELINLKDKRVEVAQKIKDAKEMGDLSENAEYHAAKEEQGFIESRIIEIESLLKSAKVLKPNKTKNQVGLGNKIKVKSKLGIQEYEIVGMNEADPVQGKISPNSPLGKAFFGAKINQEVEVNAPAGKTKFKIISIN